MFTIVRSKVRKQTIGWSRSKTKKVKFGLGDLVFVFFKWKPYNVITDETDSSSCKVKDKLTIENARGH